MRRTLAFLVFAVFVGGLSGSPATPETAPPAKAVWVFFRDKGPTEHAKPPLSERAYDRRARRAAVPFTADDLPVYEPYLRRLGGEVRRIRTVSRWLNAASVEATDEQIQRIVRWPEVREVRRVRVGRRTPELPGEPLPAERRSTSWPTPPPPEWIYGPSFRQNSRIGIPLLHEKALNGEGVLICVIDAGFTRFDHPALAHLSITATKDFVTGSAALSPDAHGSYVLSVMAGYQPSVLVGPAFGASFALARTEIAAAEIRVEEDYWIAATEWADSLGADVISSSLGYNTFDDTTANHTLAELDGSTLITQAADRAAERGIVVVLAAGNERGTGADPQWLGRITFPADGFKVLAVGATDVNDGLASFSSVGPTADGRIKPDIAAPGTDIVAADVATPDGYRLVRGTSFSCPLVAGVAALLLQAHPEWTPDDVSRAFRWTAADLGSVGPDNLFGWGIVNAVAALDAVPNGLFGTVTTRYARQPLDTATDAIPIAGARVEITGTASVLAATDVRGQFSYSPLPHGAYTITCQAPGYVTATLNASVPQTAPIRIELVRGSPGSAGYRLSPNPATTASGVMLAGAAHADLVVSFYDIAGNLVRRLQPGELHWNLRTEAGRPAAAGVYICRVEVAGVEVWRGKLAVVR